MLRLCWHGRSRHDDDIAGLGVDLLDVLVEAVPCLSEVGHRKSVRSNGRPSESATGTARADRCCTHLTCASPAQLRTQTQLWVSGKESQDLLSESEGPLTAEAAVSCYVVVQLDLDHR